MGSAELKLDLFRKLDSLDTSRLEEVYQIVINYISSKDHDWENLTEYQKDGIIQGINQLNEDKGIYHADVMKKYRSKYSHE